MWRQHKKRIQNFDYTTIEDQLRKVSWSSNSHPTGVIKPIYGYPTFLITAKAVLNESASSERPLSTANYLTSQHEYLTTNNTPSSCTTQYIYYQNSMFLGINARWIVVVSSNNR